jgi:hypothetical protein
MTPRRKQWIIRTILISIIIVLTFTIVLGALIVYQPLRIVTFATKRLAPSSEFKADSIGWTSSHSVLIENAQFGSVLKVPRLTISWNWKDLYKNQLEELKFESAELLIDLNQLDQLFGKSGKPSHSIPWLIKKFSIERTNLIMIGLGPEVPPLAINIEGSWEDLPIGGQLSQADLLKKRKVELTNLAIHSPLDLSTTILTIEKVIFDFTFSGLKIHQLEKLTFDKPVVKVDRGLFWFMEALRTANTTRPKTANPGAVWVTQHLSITQGQLDVTRLETFYIDYPFPFELERENFALKDLSLADSQIELDIKDQNIFWANAQMSFVNVHGKVSFNAGEIKTVLEAGKFKERPPIGLVNTLFVEKILWKEMELPNGWVSLVFNKDSVSGALGGEFADGYLNGGMNIGWAIGDPWQIWGSAADIDTGRISNTFNNESFAMNGRAELAFSLNGKGEESLGDLKLVSKSQGTIELRTLDKAIDRIKKNTEGIKQELLTIFVSNLRNYPYDSYTLNAHYNKPDAIMIFESKGKLGSRKLDLSWHGLQNTNQTTNASVSK